MRWRCAAATPRRRTSGRSTIFRATRRALPSYDAVLLLSPRRARDAPLAPTLAPLVGAMTVERMRQANLMVDRDEEKRTPAEVARWLDPFSTG